MNLHRNRSISPVILTTTLEIPTVSARLNADWERDISTQLYLEPGDVEELPLARARTRWPNFDEYVDALRQWSSGLVLHNVVSTAPMALMACRGARYHHDAEQYGDLAFCNLFLSEDKDLDLHFPNINLRIPLQRGTAVIFDTGQTHAVIKRSSNGFDEADFPTGSDCSLVFLTWELPIDNSHVAHALQIEFTPP